MRKIKFRIWNGESIEETIIDFNIDKETKYKEFYIYPDDVFMQFTGLKDKNGVEIYEGDIVKDSSNRLMKVEWDNRLGTSRFIFKTINKVGHIQLGRFINTHEWITSDDNDIEVIGNIYENPELLRED